MQSQLNNDDQQDSFEKKLNERLGDFDLISLLRLLKMHGIQEDAIWFSSHNSIASQNRVIESIKLINNNAFILVNIGILAPTGILPAYMRQFMDRADVDDISLQTFFKLFDHMLILSYLSQLYPEVNRSFFEDWQKTKRCYTELQNMRSECSLHWLFETAFPEFTVKLTPLHYSTTPHKSSTELGQLILGSKTDNTKEVLQRDSFNVSLALRPELISTALDWPQTVRTRLDEWVFPWLHAFSMYLEIYLCTRTFGTHLKLFERSALGYDPYFQRRVSATKNHTHQWSESALIYADRIPHRPSYEKPHIVWEDARRLSV